MSKAKDAKKQKKQKQDPGEMEVEEQTEPEGAEPQAAPEPAEEPEPLDHQLLRLRADFENYRKRTQREKQETYQRANEDLLAELLPVLDHFELGLNTAREHHADKAVVSGFELVYDQMRNALGKFGLQAVDAEGEEFDPHLHEAVSHMPSEVHPADTVVVQTRRGYRLGDRLLRAAQVVVSSGPAAGAADTEPEQAPEEESRS